MGRAGNEGRGGELERMMKMHELNHNTTGNSETESPYLNDVPGRALGWGARGAGGGGEQRWDCMGFWGRGH